MDAIEQPGEEQRDLTSAGATPQPAHTLRVEHVDGTIDYIAADEMVMGQDHIARSLTAENRVTRTLVATVFPEPGLFIARVDTLINMGQVEASDGT